MGIPGLHVFSNKAIACIFQCMESVYLYMQHSYIHGESESYTHLHIYIYMRTYLPVYAHLCIDTDNYIYNSMC